MQKGLDREGRRVPSQRRLLERDEGDFTEDASQGGGEEGAHWKGGLSEKGKGIVWKIFEGQNAYYVSFLNFRPGLINSVYNMTFFGKNPVISN